MTRDLVMLFGLFVTGAVWGFTHLMLWAHVLRASQLPGWLRWLAWIPPIVAFAAWRAGARTGALVWVVLTLAYLCLRSMA